MSCIPLMVESRHQDSEDEEDDRLQIDTEEEVDEGEDEEDEEIMALRRKSGNNHHQLYDKLDELYCWTHKHFDSWGNAEVVSWVTHLAYKSPLIDFRRLHLERFDRLTGPVLRDMSQNQLIVLEPTYGRHIHNAFQELMRNSDFKSPFTTLSEAAFDDEGDSCFESDFHEPADRPDTPPIDYSMRSCHVALPTPPEERCQSPFNFAQKQPPPLIPLFEHFQQSAASDDQPRLVRRGRPPKNRDGLSAKAARKAGAASRELLWKFVCELLNDPKYNPSHICWEKKEEGIFRFVQSEKCARMWGDRKHNPKMTYEKMSRAMRYCRSSEFFADVPKDQNYPKKLCFKFGPKATGWKQL